MERVKNEVEVAGKPKWKKLGGGSLRIGNRIIKPNEEFYALPEEISPAFRSMVKPISGDATFKKVAAVDKVPEDAPKEKDIVKTGFEMVPHGQSASWFDVVNTATGKLVNEKAMHKEVATKLLADLLK
jgi:hypothetical protein